MLDIYQVDPKVDAKFELELKGRIFAWHLLSASGAEKDLNFDWDFRRDCDVGGVYDFMTVWQLFSGKGCRRVPYPGRVRGQMTNRITKITMNCWELSSQLPCLTFLSYRISLLRTSGDYESPENLIFESNCGSWHVLDFSPSIQTRWIWS